MHIYLSMITYSNEMNWDRSEWNERLDGKGEKSISKTFIFVYKSQPWIDDEKKFHFCLKKLFNVCYIKGWTFSFFWKRKKARKIATIYNKNISMFREYAAKFFNVVWVPNHNRKEQKVYGNGNGPK